MPKSFPEEQRLLIKRLAEDGISNVDIVKHMAKLYPALWQSKHADRTVARILKEGQSFVPIKPTLAKTLDEMSREERIRFVESKLQTTSRFRITFKNFGAEEQQVFVDEYLNIFRSIESLTEAEEQMLFMSILELVLAFQALARKEREEQFRDQSLEGKISSTDPKFRTQVDKKYQDEYDQHIKLYQKGIENLKMNRQQRLKEFKSQRQTLVDVVAEYSNKTIQSEIANEIERLSKLKDDELKRLLDSGYLFGVFKT